MVDLAVASSHCLNCIHCDPKPWIDAAGRPTQPACRAEARPVQIIDRIKQGACPEGKFDTPFVPDLSVPRDEWPPKIQKIARYQVGSDRGVGDTLERRYARYGGRWYKRVRKAIGLSCDCEAEQARLNALYPYPVIPPIVE